MRELTETEYRHMQNKTSIKQRYDKKRGQEVSLDQFLFACHDTSKQLIEIDQRYRETTFWPPLSDNFSSSNLQDSIDEMIAWYKSKYSILSKPGSLDISRLGQVAKCLAYLEKDFKSLVKIISGQCLEDHLLDQHDLSPPWTHLKTDLSKYFNKTGEKIWAYFNWAYGVSPPDQVVNACEIPPASQSYHQHSRTIKNKSSKKDHHPNMIDPYRNGSRRFSKKTSNRSKNTKGKYRSSHSEYNNRSLSAKPNGFNKKSRNSNNKSFSEKLKYKEALNSVDQAIEKLNKENISAITLSPQNSYYRRIQHKHAIKRGYNSKSTGEDNSRAVMISID